jgi:hypothetical protein
VGLELIEVRIEDDDRRASPLKVRCDQEITASARIDISGFGIFIYLAPSRMAASQADALRIDRKILAITFWQFIFPYLF